MEQRWGYGLRQQPALRAIRYANVRFGILPAQSHALTANLRLARQFNTTPVPAMPRKPSTFSTRISRRCTSM